MKFYFVGLALLILGLGISCQWLGPIYPHVPGTIFLRQQVCDIDYVKSQFLLNPQKDLKGRGFIAYSLHRDLVDPKTYLIVLQCKDLKQGVDYVESSGFHAICVGAGLGVPVLWAGEDIKPRDYTHPRLGGGIAIVRAQVDSYENWKNSIGNLPSVVSLYRLLGKPDVVLEEVETAGLPTPVVLGGSGLIHQDAWYGINLDSGLF
jgi:hypothetical protein